MLQTTLVPHIFKEQGKLEELFETRKIVEVEAASLAAQRIIPQQILEMKHWIQEIKTCVARNDIEGISFRDIEFHRQIIIATNNNTLAALVDSLADLLQDMRHESSNIPDLLPKIVRGHREIMTAIENKDSEAARQAMENHLDEVAKQVKEFWQSQNDTKTGEV